MNIPSIICLILIIWAFYRDVKYLMTLCFCFQSMGTMSVLPVAWTGGVNVLPGTIALLALAMKTLAFDATREPLIGAVFGVRRFGLLSYFTIVAVFGAFMLPSLFEGLFSVFPQRPSTRFLIPEPVHASSGNISQSVYLVVSFLGALTFGRLALDDNFIKNFCQSIVVSSIFTVSTGIADAATSALQMGDVLNIFRTANYAIMTEGEISGIRRIVGLMPEASAFGSIAVIEFALLVFTRNMFSPKYKLFLVAPLSCLCGLFAFLSASSTAYVGILVVLMLFVLNSIYRMWRGGAVYGRGLFAEFGLVGFFAAFLVLLILANEETRSKMMGIVNSLLLDKPTSTSFQERASWNRLAWEALWRSNGLGVGAGTLRTSNFFLNILASTGFFGAALFAGFWINVMFGRIRSTLARTIEFVMALRMTLIGAASMMLLAGTVPDYGMYVAAIMGATVGVAGLTGRPSR